MRIKKKYSISGMISLFVILISSFTFNQSFSENISDYNDNNIKSYLLSKTLEAEIDKVSTILEITSKLPEMRKSPNATLLSETIETYNGIPELSEQEKRKVLKNIVLNYDDISGAAFLMTNGDMYIREPFNEQLNLNKTNLSFREYYKGALQTGAIYMDNVIISVATEKPIAVTAIPIFANNTLEKIESNKEIVGILYSTLNFNVPNQLLKSLNLTNSERVVYLDHLGNKIADSSKIAPQNETSIFSNLQSFNNSISGISGTIIEDVNNTKMIISYNPVKSVQNTWALLWMKPHTNDMDLTS
ncbi:MAG: PDC sensor domain-containing protein [Nitrososphaeraceae archaeon]